MFDSEFLKKLEYLSLVTRKTFAGHSMAGHRNSKLGGGVEFADYRNYVYGDDLRHLDWNVYARLGSSLIKRFQEEGDMRVYCCLDVSGSMGPDSSSAKISYARQVTAALAYISLSRFDTVSVVSFAKRFESQYPPVRGKQHFLSLMKYIDALDIIEGETDFDTFVDDLLHRNMTPGLILLVSDCFDHKGLEHSLDRLLHSKFEPVVLQVYEPNEADPALRGDYHFTDMESGRSKKITVNESVRKRYKRCFQQFVNSIQQHCQKRGCSSYAVSTDIPFDRFILEMARDMASVR